MRTAVVVGGGIGGLGAAIALRRAGWHVTVLERSPKPAEIGAGLTLMANGQRALRALGLAEVVHADARPQGGGGIRDPRGRWIARVDGAYLARTVGTAIIGIHRESLHRLLREALPPGAVVPGARVTDVVPGPPASVTYRLDGATRTVGADLVVAADGIRSFVRAALWPGHPGPRYTGTTAWRAVTRRPWTMDVAAMSTWGAGAEFGIVPLADGRVYWFAAARAPEGRRGTDELAEVRARFGGWHGPIPDLLAAARPEDVLRHDLYELARPLPPCRRGAVVLLGDAAHAMTPHLGQGAAQALEDAVVLGALCTGRDLEAALSGYDRLRRRRTQAVAAASRWAGRLGPELRGAPLVAARDAALRALPALTLRQAARFTRWTPPREDGARPAPGPLM
ncbi:FAD-dependent oxidoreductase [Georgenia sp. AZ-5]|uniref:FAD-dependent oxidoreductase n=1 Tax=Georgenia sp. AZ-5 TaxID=3367526 RepID=UPI003754144B